MATGKQQTQVKEEKVESPILSDVERSTQVAGVTTESAPATDEAPPAPVVKEKTSTKEKVLTIPEAADVLFLQLARRVMAAEINMADARREVISWFNTALSEGQRAEYAVQIKQRAERLRVFSEALHQEVTFVSSQPTV